MKKVFQIKPSSWRDDGEINGGDQPIVDKLPNEVPLVTHRRARRFGAPKSPLRAIDRSQLYQGQEALLVNTNSRVLKSDGKVADELCEMMWDRGGNCFITKTLKELRTAVEQMADKRIGRVYTIGGDGSIFTLSTVVSQVYSARDLPLPEIVILGGGTSEDALHWMPGDYKRGDLLKTMKCVTDNLENNLVAVSQLKTIRIRMREQAGYTDLLGHGDQEYLATAFGTGVIAEFLKLYNEIPNKAVRHVWTIVYKAALSAIAPISLRISMKELEEIHQALENDQHQLIKKRYNRGLIGFVIRLYCGIPGKWLKKHVGRPWLLKLLAAQKYFILFTRHRELVTLDGHYQRNVRLRTVMAGVPASYSRLPGIKKHFFKLFPKAHLLEEMEGFNVLFFNENLFNTFAKFITHFFFRTRTGHRYLVKDKLMLEGVGDQDIVATLNGETFESDYYSLSPGPTFRVICPIHHKSKVRLSRLQEYYIPV